MLNETELTLINGGLLSYGARLLYLTVLVPCAEDAKVVLNFDYIKVALSICRPNHMGVTILEKAPQTHEIENWLLELITCGLISTQNPYNTEQKKTEAINNTNNGVTNNIRTPNNFNPSRPDEIHELPSYITNPSLRITELAKIKEQKIQPQNNPHCVPWTKQIEQEEYEATQVASSTKVPTQTVTNYLNTNNQDSLAYMKEYAKQTRTPNTKSSNRDTLVYTDSANITSTYKNSSVAQVALCSGNIVYLLCRLPLTKVTGELFKMTREWHPTSDFTQLATFVGLSGIGYSLEELNDFVTYWSLKDTALDTTSWTLKFIRFLKAKRYHH